MINKICSLCGTHYNDKRGHSASDCWGILHQALLEASRTVRGLEYKLEEAQKRINIAKAERVNNETN